MKFDNRTTLNKDKSDFENKMEIFLHKTMAYNKSLLMIHYVVIINTFTFLGKNLGIGWDDPESISSSQEFNAIPLCHKSINKFQIG